MSGLKVNKFTTPNVLKVKIFINLFITYLSMKNVVFSCHTCKKRKNYFNYYVITFILEVQITNILQKNNMFPSVKTSHWNLWYCGTKLLKRQSYINKILTTSIIRYFPSKNLKYSEKQLLARFELIIKQNKVFKNLTDLNNFG